MRTTVAGALAGLTTASLLAVAPLGPPAEATRAAESAAFQVRPIDWGPCEDVARGGSGVQCGMLEVPLDHADPEGVTIELAVMRVRHTRTPYRGAVVTNPGGPGASGTSLAMVGSSVPGRVADTYDWYGMDPRGVGESRPALTCDGQYAEWDRPPYVPERPRVMKAWLATTERYAADCAGAPARRLLPHLRTTDNAADVDLLRQAIGAEQITFYGFSYGTYLGQVYATLHPDRVKALILDGVVDPGGAWYAANLSQDRAFERSYQRFLGWVGNHDRRYDLGVGRKAVGRTVDRLAARLDRSPADGKFGPAELTDIVQMAAYYNSYYPVVADALSSLASGRAAGAKWLYRSGNPVGKGADNLRAIYLATECTDAPWPSDWSVWRDDMWRMHERAPFLTWANAWFNAPCRTWPVPSGPAFEVDGSAVDAPVLLLNETLDAATPYSGALAVRELFSSSSLVAGVGGTSHSVSLSGIPCTDDTIAAVLRDGSLPQRASGSRADKECRPVPPPRRPLASRAPAHRRPVWVR